jgi:hypothetical protein
MRTCGVRTVVHSPSYERAHTRTRAHAACVPHIPTVIQAWDNGATHGVSVHRLPNKTYVLFYMGSMQDWGPGRSGPVFPCAPPARSSLFNAPLARSSLFNAPSTASRLVAAALTAWLR